MIFVRQFCGFGQFLLKHNFELKFKKMVIIVHEYDTQLYISKTF